MKLNVSIFPDYVSYVSHKSGLVRIDIFHQYFIYFPAVGRRKLIGNHLLWKSN